jgi:alpha-tubulin suppressor-like RCC1 family protein
MRCHRLAVAATVLLGACGAHDTTAPTPAVVRAVSVGVFFGCLVKTSGEASCWGRDYGGQLGNGTTIDTAAPVPVRWGYTYSSLSAGQDFACGVSTSGPTYCWGQNIVGQLGNGTFNGPQTCTNAVPCSTVPIAVQNGQTFTRVSVGGDFACGVTSTAAAYCWGWNEVGQLGIGILSGPESCSGNPCSTLPRPVAGGLAFTTVSAGGYSACALASSGKAYCWGYDQSGQLGDSSTTTTATPVLVAGGLVFKAVSAGATFACGLTPAGVAYCWGDNTYGELGDSTTTGPEQCSGKPCSTTPVAVAGSYTFGALTAGNGFACGLTASGAAYCWGLNAVGELGVGDTLNRTAPVPVAGNLLFAALSAGNSGACGVTPDGTAYCWGYGRDGELGDGLRSSVTVPVRVQ